MQLALGAVYGWSVFVNPLREHFGASRLEINLTFTITLMVLGIAAGVGGHLQHQFGPRAIAGVAGVLYGAGVFLSGLAPNLTALYLSQGVLGGIGLGLGYIVPLAVLIGWFPDKRGLITGFAVTGFGLGAVVTGPLATELIRTMGVQNTLMVLGIAYFIVVVLSAQVLVAPPESHQPSDPADPIQRSLYLVRHSTLAEALRTPHWYLLWLMLAVNVAAGAAVISVAAPLTQELTNASPTKAAMAVCLIALFNGAGRLFWGALSDWLGRARTFLTIFFLQVLAFALIPEINNFAVLLFPLALIALCYGGGFGTMPAFVTDVFGSRNSGSIYGAMLTAWSAGAVAGPMLISAVPYRMALTWIAGLLAAAAVLPFLFNALVQMRIQSTCTLPVTALADEAIE
jgi:OFA family oxalate/formate antiporter-like MFS transporter